MKKLILSFTIIATLLSCQEKERTTFEINGTIENPGKATSVILMNLETRVDIKTLIDTIAVASIENGTYKLTGSVKQPVKVIALLERNRFQFVLENDVFTVTSNAEGSTIEGGKTHPIVTGYKKDPVYQKANKEAREVTNRLSTDLGMIDKEAVTKAFYEKVSEVNKIKSDYGHKVLEGDYPTLAKLYILSDNFDWDRYGVDDRIAMSDGYDKALNGNKFAKRLKQVYVKMKEDDDRKKSVAVGQPFKEVIAHTLEGAEIKLSDVVSKNKYTLLEMWASWCGPCRAEFPHLKKAYAKYNSKGFEIYGLSLDKKKDRWAKAMNEENAPWINVVDYNGLKGKAAQDYVVNGIPATFLINQDGKIVASITQARGIALDKKLEELFTDE